MIRRGRALRHHASRYLMVLCVLPVALFAAAGRANYHIDPSSSEAMFRVRLFWVDKVNGHFTRVDGEVAPGPLPASWVVNATIPVDSVTMPSSRMRQWVLAPSFFDAQRHPTIHFVSNPFGQDELDRGGTLSGYLTLRGITAPIHFAVQPAHCTASTLQPCRILLRGNLQRSTFGMTSDRVALSDSVDLNLSITLQREIR